MTGFSFVEELDLYSLFQNALTNAINAVSALPEGVERFISLSSVRDGNMLTIHMENPCEDDIAFVDGLPQTKNDPDWHGFGMKSMNRIAEKYNGMLTAEQRGKMFFLDILCWIRNNNYDVKPINCAVRLAAGRVFLYDHY